MMRLLRALLGLGQVGVDLYKIARVRFFMIVGFLYFVILIEWAMKYWGFMIVDIMISYALFAITLIISTRPEVIAALEAMEAARAARKARGKTIEPRVPDENYFLLYTAYALQWVSIVSLFVTTLPFGWYLSFGESFLVTFTGLMFISVIAWAAFFKWTKKVYYKRIIIIYAVCGLLVCVWMIVPGSMKYSVTGLDYYGLLGTSETAKALAKAQRKINVKIDEAKAAKIKDIGNKLAGNGDNEDLLTFEERAIWHEAQKEIRDASLPEKLSQLELPSFVKNDSEYVPPPPAPAPAPAPAAQVVSAAPTEAPAPKINISGDWSFDWQDPGTTGFRISQIGTSLSGKSHYSSGEMILTGSVHGTSAEGTWELIGHPAGHLQGRFYITSLTESAGEGKWVHNDGHTTRLIIKKV